MAVNSEQLFMRGKMYRDSMAEHCTANKNVSSDLLAEPHHTVCLVGVAFSPIIAHQMLILT